MPRIKIRKHKKQYRIKLYKLPFKLVNIFIVIFSARLIECFNFLNFYFIWWVHFINKRNELVIKVLSEQTLVDSLWCSGTYRQLTTQISPTNSKLVECLHC
ncbi:hypothetical protein UREOM_4950 [Ureaplasma sp. OM1]|uniref:Uncharacterized protein n=1 Tax=Ureaplasma ceti TaxID=3119530 RepID=A0ABP9U7J0_9BACT